MRREITRTVHYTPSHGVWVPFVRYGINAEGMGGKEGKERREEGKERKEKGKERREWTER